MFIKRSPKNYPYLILAVQKNTVQAKKKKKAVTYFIFFTL